jgi:hypothetical protein
MSLSLLVTILTLHVRFLPFLLLLDLQNVLFRLQNLQAALKHVDSSSHVNSQRQKATQRGSLTSRSVMA